MIEFYKFPKNIKIEYSTKLQFNKDKGLYSTLEKKEYEILKLLDEKNRFENCVNDNPEKLNSIMKFKINEKLKFRINDYLDKSKISLVEKCRKDRNIVLTDTAGLQFIIDMNNITANSGAVALSGEIYATIFKYNKNTENTIKKETIFDDYKTPYNSKMLDPYYTKYLSYSKDSTQYAVFKEYNEKNGDHILKIIHSIGPNFRESDVCRKTIDKITNLNDITKDTDIYKLFYAVYKSIYTVFNDQYKTNTLLKLYMVPYSIGVFAGNHPKNKVIILYTIIKVLVDILEEDDYKFTSYLYIEPDFIQNQVLKNIILDLKIEDEPTS